MHADYIAGVGKYAERDDVQFVADRNLPGWAKDGSEFFRAADQHERANGRVYTEIEAAIPRGCADPVAYATEYAEQLLGKDHPYRLAVHDKLAADGGRNVHMHLMFTDRKLDGIERGPEQFFKRASAPYRHRTTKEMMPADPAKGGAAKDRKWNDRKQVPAVRAGWEAHAKARGFDLDLRSNLAQGLTRAEPKIGPQRKRSKPDLVRDDRKREVDQIRSYRTLMAAAKAELTTIEKEQRNERIKQRRAQHRQYAARTEAPRIDRVPRMHERRHYGDAPRAQHLLPGNAFDRLGERQAAERAYRVQLENDRAARVAKQQAAIKATATQERSRREGRRGAWQAKHLRTPGVAPRAGVTPSPGKPRYWEYSDGPAKGFAAVVDYGDRIKPTGNLAKLTDHKVAALLEVAKAKGWTAITVTGDQAFRERVASAAAARGLGLLDADLRMQIEAKRLAAAPKTAPAQARQEAIQSRAESSDRFRAKLDEIAKRLESGIPPAPAPAAKAQTAIEQAREAKAELARVKAQLQAQLAKRQAARNPATSSLSEPSTPAAQPLAALPRAPELLGREKDHAQRLVEDKQPGEKSPAVKAYIAEERRLVDAERAIADELAKVKPHERTDTGIRAEAVRTARAQVGHNHWNSYGEGRLENERWHAAKALSEHEATKRPSLFGGKGWDAQRGTLAAKVGDLDKQIAARDAALAAITERETRALTAKYKAEETAKAERRGELGKRLEDVREQRAVHLSKQPAELKQQRQERAAKALEKSKSLSNSRGGLSR